MAEITNKSLHMLFHNLLGPIGAINMTSQICISYVTKFDMEKLHGKLEENLTSAYNSIFPRGKIVSVKLRLVVDVLTEIGSQNIGDTLLEHINRGLKDIEDIEISSKEALHRLMKNGTGRDLAAFAREMRKIDPVCQSMVKAIKSCKDKLAAAGKY